MTLGDIGSLLRDKPIVNAKAWNDAEAHYVTICFDASIVINQVDKETFDIEKIYNLIDSSVGFAEDAKDEVQEGIKEFIDKDAFCFYKPDMKYEFTLTLAGNNCNRALTAFFDLPPDRPLSEAPIFSTYAGDNEATNEFMRLFFIGHSIANIQASDDDIILFEDDEAIRFTLSNGVYFETTSFGLEILSQNKFIRYTPANGIEDNPDN